MSAFEIHGDENGIVVKAPGYREMQHLRLASPPYFKTEPYDPLSFDLCNHIRRVTLVLECWHEFVEPEPEPPTIYGEGVWLH